MKPVRFEDLQIFVRVAEIGNFSRAARELDVSSVVASNAVRRLEDVLGVRLFARTTRHLRLSDAGIAYLPYAQAALNAADGGERVADAYSQGNGARLHVSVPSDIGRNQLVHWMDEYLRSDATRQVHLQISVGDTLANLHASPVDLAIRYGKPKDSGLVLTPICHDNFRTLCAAPAYLARHPPISTLADLAHHNCLRYKVNETVYSRWLFGEGDAAISLQVDGDRVSDDAEIVRRWAVAGAGVAYKSELDVAEDVAAGRLVRILPEVQGERLPLSLLAVHRDQLTPMVTGLVKQMRQKCVAHLQTMRS